MGKKDVEKLLLLDRPSGRWAPRGQAHPLWLSPLRLFSISMAMAAPRPIFGGSAPRGDRARWALLGLFLLELSGLSWISRQGAGRRQGRHTRSGSRR